MTKKKAVLFVDDEKNILNSLEKLLRTWTRKKFISRFSFMNKISGA